MSFSKLFILKSVDDKNFTTNKIIGVLKVVKEKEITIHIDFYTCLKNECLAFICDGEKEYFFYLSNDLKQHIAIKEQLNLDKFTFCVFEKDDFNILALTFNGNTKIDVLDLKKLIKQNFNYKKDDYVYDDEQLATENYYATDGVSYQDENIDGNYLQTQKKEEDGRLPIFNETIVTTNENHFTKVKDKVNDLLSNNTKNEFLNLIYKNGIFVDVKYSKNGYYSFGIIYDDGSLKNAKYICYVVLGTYNNVPKGFENISKFIPLKNYLPYGDGYFIIFQDAFTGKTLVQHL